MVRPLLELFSRAAAIRAVFNSAVRDGGSTSCHAAGQVARVATAPALHDIKWGSLFAGLADAGPERWGGADDGWGWRLGWWLWVVEEVPDLSGDVAFEAAERFAFGLAV